MLFGTPSLSLQMAPTSSLWGVLHRTAQYFSSTHQLSIQSSMPATGSDGIFSPVLGLFIWRETQTRLLLLHLLLMTSNLAAFRAT